MGNESCTGRSVSNKIDRALTKEQIILIQETWRLLKQDLTKSGVIIFTRFFETNPEMKELFPRIITINDENRLDFEIDRKMIEKHSTRVMEGLGATVESLDNPYVLDNVLKGLGQTHARKQIKGNTLKKMWPSLDYGLTECLGEQYTRESAEAWRKFYEYICHGMKESMKGTHEDLT